ncbi:MAG TPA: hypothetical protein VL588_02575 [Bdellovibrionota bacterium]|nr:hypothetical protein [Bdellovibrionota bacterium]
MNRGLIFAGVGVLLSSVAQAGPMPGDVGDTGGTCPMPEELLEQVCRAGDGLDQVSGTQAVQWDRLREPPRLEPDRYMPQDIFCQRDCTDAANPACRWRPRFPGRRVGMVAVMSHLCDGPGEAKACLRIGRELADRCNRFVQDNMAVYQTRYYRNTPDRSIVMDEDPNMDRYGAQYGTSGPTGIFFDIRDCDHIRRLGDLAGADKMGLQFPLDHQPPAAERHRRLEAAVRTVPGLNTVLTGATPAPGEPPLPEGGCLGPGPSLEDGWNALETQEQGEHTQWIHNN